MLENSEADFKTMAIGTGTTILGFAVGVWRLDSSSNAVEGNLQPKKKVGVCEWTTTQENSSSERGFWLNWTSEFLLKAGQGGYIT